VPFGWGPDGRVIYWHSSPTEPGDLWSIHPDDGAAPQRLTWSAPLELEAKLRPPEEVVLTAADGQAVSALVYLPAGHEPGRRYPPIVWVKGGPTGAARFDYAPLLSWLANEGFLVVTPNYRGSTGYGVPFMEAVAGDGLGRNDLADVLAAGEFARAHPAADTARGAGIGGRSWGGYLTLMAVTRAPEAFSCAVAGAAISDWAVQQAQTETRAYDRWLVGGWLYEREALARERSPITGAGRVRAPLFVYHGEADLNVPFAQIAPFVDRVRQAGASVAYVAYPFEGHSNQLPENQADVLEKTRAFFRRHLQPWNFRDNPTAGQEG
jgi:dipeptidyl aminopeptidase/acylaminoacyl peptidase